VKRLVIAIDCDDVLVQTTPFLVNSYNRIYGTNATLAQSCDPAYDIWQADEDLQMERWGKLIELEGYKDLSPDSREAHILRMLAREHELHLVTARNEHEREFTQSMLNRELEGVFTSMEFTGWQGSKGDVCESIRADVLIDDGFRHLASAYDCGISDLIWFGNYPWQTEDSKDIPVRRCCDWREVEAEIERIASR